MRFRPSYVVFALTLVASASCLQIDPEVGLPNAGCTRQAKAFCQKLADCSPFLLAQMWKDQQTCTARTEMGCIDALAAKDQVWTSDELKRCSDQVASMSCDALFSWNLDVMVHTPWNVLGDPASYSRCFPRYGRRPDDTPCTADGQCSSGWCKPGKSGKCGACRGIHSASMPCTSAADCAPNDQCTSKGTCWDIADLGHSCSPEAQICAPGLFCEYTSCVANKRALGEPCDLKTPCDATRGLFCAASMKCEAIALAAIGESCGANATCKGDAFCDPSGTCVARAADDAACSAVTQCTYPRQCLDGTCRMLDASACK